MLTISNLSAFVGEKKILSNINYHFEKNKIYVIMGPNGSGKSSLAHSIMGNPLYTLSDKSRLFFAKQNITTLSPDKRAKAGIFMSFQSPLSLNGVSVFQLIRNSIGGKQDVLKLKMTMEKYAKELHIGQDLMERSFNKGASGGEKKKLEVLQAIMLNPKFAIFDEIDSGVDIDALKLIFAFLKKKRKHNTYIFITHNAKILSYIKPDGVLILKNGRLVGEGNARLIQHIETHGYEKNKKDIS